MLLKFLSSLLKVEHLKFQINFDPNYKQQCHVESLKVSRDNSAAFEAKTTLKETAAMNRGLDLEVFNADIGSAEVKS